MSVKLGIQLLLVLLCLCCVTEAENTTFNNSAYFIFLFLFFLTIFSVQLNLLLRERFCWLIFKGHLFFFLMQPWKYVNENMYNLNYTEICFKMKRYIVQRDPNNYVSSHFQLCWESVLKPAGQIVLLSLWRTLERKKKNWLILWLHAINMNVIKYSRFTIHTFSTFCCSLTKIIYFCVSPTWFWQLLLLWPHKFCC